jgi:hypothetical protein
MTLGASKRRRALVLGAAIAALEAVVYSAFTPQLGWFTRRFGLDDGQVALLVMAYPFGTVAGAAFASLSGLRRQPRAVAVAGLLLVALSTAAVGFAPSFVVLFFARLGQGGGGTLAWIAAVGNSSAQSPARTQGKAIAVVLSAGLLGGLAGPVIGTAALWLGREVSALALGGVAAALGGFAGIGTYPTTRTRPPVAGAIREFVPLISVFALGAAASASVTLLAITRLVGLGVSTGALAALVTGACLLETAAVVLVGRHMDQATASGDSGWNERRPLLVVLAALPIGIVATREPVVIACLFATVGPLFAVVATRSATLLSLRAQQLGEAPMRAPSLLTGAWALAYFAGSALTAVAEGSGQLAPAVLGLFVLVALVGPALDRRSRTGDDLSDLVTRLRSATELRKAA